MKLIWVSACCYSSLNALSRALLSYDGGDLPWVVFHSIAVFAFMAGAITVSRVERPWLS